MDLTREMSSSTSTFSYLPTPTRDPARDFAHPGYRLATLSALPPAVPLSRIRLADAGFYYQGRGDEVVCYSCGARHSGWRPGDNPLEVHRRLSPQCLHVAGRDGEAATVASLGACGAGPGGGGGCGGGGDGAGRGTAGSGGPSGAARPPAPTTSSSGTAPGTGETVAPAVEAAEASNVGEDGEPPATVPRRATPAVPSSSPGPQPPPPRSSNSRFVSADGGSRPPTTTSHVTGAVPVAVSTAASRDEAAPRGLASQAVSTSSSRGSSSSGAGIGGGGRGDAEGGGGSSLFPRAGLDLGGAVYPMYQDMQSRRRTFNTWDATKAPPLDLVILCGMFYAGYADCVRCFYCGVGLKHWLPTDDVWTEHVRWRPTCQYLRAIKGEDFIRETQDRLTLQGGASLPTETSSRPQGRAPAAAAQPPQALSVPATTLTSPSDVTPSVTPPTADNATTTSTADGTTPAASGDVADHPSPFSSAVSSDRPRASSGVVGNEAEDRETVDRLQAENEALTQRLRCRVCHTAAVDTILMPCGHLVCCETCARSVRTCPLCQETIRATARVHLS